MPAVSQHTTTPLFASNRAAARAWVICEAGSPPKKQTQNVSEFAVSASCAAEIVSERCGEKSR